MLVGSHLLLLLFSGPLPLVGLRLPDPKTGPIILGAAFLHRLAESVLRGRERARERERVSYILAQTPNLDLCFVFHVTTGTGGEGKSCTREQWRGSPMAARSKEFRVHDSKGLSTACKIWTRVE